MIFSTLNQLNCWLIFLILGFCFAIIYDLFYTLLKIKKPHKKLKNIKKILFESIFFSFFSIIFIFLLNYFNFGELSIALIFASILGFLWMSKLIKNLVVFFKNKCYTKSK